MCKHILINQFTLNDLDVLKQFASMSKNERDGYGSIMRTKAGTIETIKSLDSTSFYIDLVQRLQKGDIETLVVHHRTSTNSLGLDYAHPFNFERWYMTHNGVVCVPGLHETKTTNDSEALLHHLIKTDYNTFDIQGYFSCFLLSSTETIVLVDDIAPIYTDGRIYSSHKLTNDQERIALALISLSRRGDIEYQTAIQTTSNSYGMDKAWQSIGYTSHYDEPIASYDNIIDFFDYTTDWELFEIKTEHNERKRIKLIADLGKSLGIKLKSNEIKDIIKHIDEEAS